MLHRTRLQSTVAHIILILCVASCREAVPQDSEYASTYLGGKDHEFCEAIALDDDGNIYVAGNTRSLDFPTTPGAYNRESQGRSDVFIAKFDNGLQTLLASTFIGGDEDECAYTILYDPEGYVYVAGYTSSENVPTTDRSYDSSYNGGDGDAFKIYPSNQLGKARPTLPTNAIQL